ncbi:MAG: hypothetical protein RBS39_00005, partial [Phycisphaerales bacterium]|nr:hypothetical protein [Phycisphaerales bacterium]
MAKKVSKKAESTAKGGGSRKSAESAPVRGELALERVPRLGDVLGQDRAVGVLRRALESGRLHHAWIFAGPMGVGKFTTALALAALALDPSTGRTLAGELEADEDGPVQKLLRAGSHPDLHVVTKEMAAYSRERQVRDSKQRTIPVDVVREFLIEPSQRSRQVAGASMASRVFIVDGAEFMNAAAQNALLKTLEEPPAGVLIVLVTTAEDRLLPTIRSRCQRVGFGELDDRSMRAWLASRGLDERGDELMELVGCSPGRALAALSNGLAEWRDAVWPMVDAALSGREPVEMGSTMHGLCEEWAKAWVKANPDASKEAANHAAVARMLELVSRRVREHMSRGRGEMPALVSAVDALREAESLAERNVNLQFVFDDLAARLGE